MQVQGAGAGCGAVDGDCQHLQPRGGRGPAGRPKGTRGSQQAGERSQAPVQQPGRPQRIIPVSHAWIVRLSAGHIAVVTCASTCAVSDWLYEVCAARLE